MRARRFAYLSGLTDSQRLAVPVIVVGNLAAGGTGKTPLVIWLAERCVGWGLRPGILCRGYGGRAGRWPRRVAPDADPRAVGDEAVLLARRCPGPVMAGPDRVAAGRALLEREACDLLISDDGLQHYRLARDVEIAVVDGLRRHGNGWCLPAGPLREPVSRLRSVDLVVCKGRPRRGEHAMALEPAGLARVRDDAPGPALASLAGRRVHAVAGIGHPQQFFETLEGLGLDVVPHAFPDHHDFTPADLEFADPHPVLMTEKDAVKCRAFAAPTHWYLAARARLPEAFEHRVLRLLAGCGLAVQEHP